MDRLVSLETVFTFKRKRTSHWRVVKEKTKDEKADKVNLVLKAVLKWKKYFLLLLFLLIIVTSLYTPKRLSGELVEKIRTALVSVQQLK